MSELQAIGGEIEDALERVRVPAYVIDKHGVILWMNAAGLKIFGDVVGQHLTVVVAPEERLRAEAIFARNLAGPPSGSDNKGLMLDSDDNRILVEVSAVPLRNGGHVIGVFGQVRDIEDDELPIIDTRLTPRQHEVLRLLDEGRSTEQIARELFLSIHTVRNHIRHIMRALNARSRLEAVAVARRAASPQPQEVSG